MGPGRTDITTRSNLQIRNLQPKDIVRVLNGVRALGMSSRGSGADNIRNITASPITGIDPHELYDVAPLAEAMGNYIFNSRDMYGLPRKFNIAFDNGGSISVVADTNDIGFIAVRVPEGRDVPAGVYFRVLLCGITGHRQFATDCGDTPKAGPDGGRGGGDGAGLYTNNGDRTDRKKARLKYLVDKWGVAKLPVGDGEAAGLPADSHASRGVRAPARSKSEGAYRGVSADAGGNALHRSGSAGGAIPCSAYGCDCRHC